MKHSIKRSWFVLVWALFSLTAVISQGTCTELVEEALASVDDNCEGLERNSACYGFNLVQAAFLSDIPADFFSLPGDLADIFELETITTSALDSQSGSWGVAVMTVQANIPNTIPGQNVTFVLMGDTEVENAVAPEDAFVPSDGIEVTVNSPQGANIRSGPGLNFNVIGVAGANETLQADGQSVDGEWFRVAFGERLGWVNQIVLLENEALTDLTVLSPELRTPMQAFYLRTGIGTVACEEVPDDMLLVQGPDNIEIVITVNGANVVIGSTIGLRVIEQDGEPFLEIIVFAGRAEVEGVRIPQGQRSLLCLGEPDNRGLDGNANDQIVTCEPSPPEPIEDFGEQWCVLEQLPASILNYPIEILCPGETPAPATTITNDTGSSEAIQSQIPGVDCSSFALLGPFSDITPRPTTFQWTEAPGATDYEIVFYNYEGNVAQSFFTTETSINLNVGDIPTGSELQWEVRAWQNGQYACVTSRSDIIVRLADPLGASVSGVFSAYKGPCNAGGIVDVVWSDAPDSSVLIEWVVLGTPQSANRSGTSGSYTINGVVDWPVNIRVSSGGITINLGSCP